MEYRRFGGLDWKVSALGFGCMRLPVRADEKEIDEEEAIRLIRHAIDRGVNYMDTAYGYHGGQSELVVGRALRDGYRGRVKLATKLPCWKVEKADDFDRFLDEQLQKLQTGQVDFYLLHSLNRKHWGRMRDLGVLARAERAMADGRVGKIGFSFHDDYQIFTEIVDAYPWTFCQIQYNYMDVEEQAGTRGLQYAAAKGLAVAIMEPLLGGRLVAPPQAVQAVWDAAPVRRTPADWALQWLWNQPEVSVVLSGMGSMAQVEENLASAERSGIGKLTAEELAVVDRVRAVYRGFSSIPCTKCGYCQPCPEGVDIPSVFEVYNGGLIYDKMEMARGEYKWIPEGKRAGLCRQCRSCEDKCPQRIEIGDWMPKIHEALG